MSVPVIELEPLLYYLHEYATGSWSQFTRATKHLHPEADAFSLARGLSEHGLVEFLWDGNKSWSVTAATAIVANRPGGRIALWGGTHRAAARLNRAGIKSQIERRRMVHFDATYEYLHAIDLDVSNASELTPYVAVANSRDIVSSISPLENMLLKAPVCAEPSSNAHTYRYVYRFASASDDDPKPFVPESPSLWRVGNRRFVFVSRGHIRQVPDWLGKWLLYAAERKETYAALYVREGGILTLPFSPLLPPPYVRALLFSGGAEITPSQFGTRCFSNVEESLALDVCAKLSIDPEIIERRIRAIA